MESFFAKGEECLDGMRMTGGTRAVYIGVFILRQGSKVNPKDHHDGGGANQLCISIF
jgi:ribosomal protein L2